MKKILKYGIVIMVMLILVTSCEWQGTFTFTYDGGEPRLHKFEADYFDSSYEEEVLINSEDIKVVYDNFELDEGTVIIEMVSPKDRVVFKRVLTPDSPEENYYLVQNLVPGREYTVILTGINARDIHIELFVEEDDAEIKIKDRH
ncbi:MAG: hypothetical protein ACOCZT_01970 [Halanaerobiales bacterium]